MIYCFLDFVIYMLNPPKKKMSANISDFFSVVSCDTTETSNAELMEKTLLELSEVIQCINCFGIIYVIL